VYADEKAVIKAAIEGNLGRLKGTLLLLLFAAASMPAYLSQFGCSVGLSILLRRYLVCACAVLAWSGVCS
jgi:hypothetical protein